MKFEFKPSFARSLRSFSKPEQADLKRVTGQFIDLLSGRHPIPRGMGLKLLRQRYWEIRQGLRSRILFRWQGELVEFILAGDHNDIRRFLKK